MQLVSNVCTISDKSTWQSRKLMTIYKKSIDDGTKRLIYFFLRKNGSFRYSKQEQLTNENPLNNEKYKYNSFLG